MLTMLLCFIHFLTGCQSDTTASKCKAFILWPCWTAILLMNSNYILWWLSNFVQSPIITRFYDDYYYFQVQVFCFVVSLNYHITFEQRLYFVLTIHVCRSTNHDQTLWYFFIVLLASASFLFCGHLELPYCFSTATTFSGDHPYLSNN
jgi:hypothetical protein